MYIHEVFKDLNQQQNITLMFRHENSLMDSFIIYTTEKGLMKFEYIRDNYSIRPWTPSVNDLVANDWVIVGSFKI